MDGVRAPAYLLWRNGGQLCALPLSHVAQTMRPLPVTPVGAMPPFVLGLAMIAGGPVPVLDAGRLLGGQGANPTRFVTLRTGGRLAALAVDAVVGVQSLAADALEVAPALLGDVGRDLVTAIGSLDGELLLVLETARLVSEQIWRGVEAARVDA
jgi:purine-binding chemotaxis protein CheW